MTDDPRAALAAALDSGDDAHAALQVLRHAIAWAGRAIATPVRNGDGPLAIELVIALDDALEQVDDLLAQVPALAEQGVAGAPVTEYLERQAQALAEISDQIAVARREHEALFAMEAELRASKEEHGRIQQRIDELQRLDRLEKSLPELREQHQRLARQLEAMITPVAAAEQALVDLAEQIVTLSTERRQDLAKRTNELLAEVSESEQRWAESMRQHADAEERLATLGKDYEELREELERRLAALRIHARIDEELQERLGAAGESVDQVRGILAETDGTLERVEQALGEALERYDRFVEQHRAVLPWRDDS